MGEGHRYGVRYPRRRHRQGGGDHQRDAGAGPQGHAIDYFTDRSIVKEWETLLRKANQ